MEEGYIGEVKLEKKDETQEDYTRKLTLTAEVASDMQLKYGGYKGFKAKMDYVIGRTANDFAEIGQMLKEARDTDILKDSGYSGMGEFALKEYGLRPDQTSRFIGIFEKFGNPNGGIKEEYQSHGLTKLSEMLSLPDSVAEAIPADLSKEEIRQIKEEVKQEQAITPLEVAMEGQQADSPLTAMLKAYFHGKPAELRGIFEKWEETKTEADEKKLILDVLAPSGVAVLESRPAGLGKILLTFDGEEKEPKLTQIREDQTSDVKWLELQSTIDEILKGPMGEDAQEGWETPEEAWEGLYGEEMPETPNSPCEKAKPEAKVKIAPAQPEKIEKKQKEMPDSPKAELNPMPEPEEHDEPQLHGTQDDRDCIKVIKDKTGFLEMLLKDVKRLKPEEEAWSIEDLMEKVESAGQELQAALIDFASVRRKEVEK